MKVKTNVNGLKAMTVRTAQGAYNYGAGTFGGILNRNMMPLDGIGAGANTQFYGFFRLMIDDQGMFPAGNAATKGLYFMKGAVPTQDEFDTWYGTGATNVTADSGIFRASDLLIKYVPVGGNWSNGNLVSIFNPTVAANTGVATWYMFGSFQCTLLAVWPRPTDLLIGTVTAIGGGGDIELLNTSIVSGTTYRIPQYEMRLPTKFNV